MTVSTTLNKQIFAGNAATTVFTFSFAFPGGLAAQEAANIQVFYTSPAGVVTQLIQGITANNYQISFNNPISPNPTPIGGSVTYNPPGGPIPLGSFLTIYRNVPLVQQSSFANQGTLYQPAIEAALDYLAMSMQQVFEVQSRALVVAVSDPTPLPLPSATARAGLVLGFDSNGNPVAVTGTGGGGGGGVTSFNARTGTVLPALNDYGFSLLSGNISVSQMASGVGASATTFWRGDGAWIRPSFASLSGNIAIGQMNGGSGATSSTFWRGDGTWAAVPGAPGGTSGQVQINSSGAFGGITNTALTALINIFSPTLSGAVPASGGGTTNFLRADGNWVAPAGGGGGLWPPAQRAVTSSPTISSTDVILNCNFSSSTTINLPQASTRAGKPLTFVDAGLHATANPITLSPFSGDTFVNWTSPSSLVMNGNGQVVTIYPFNDGVNTGWFIA